MIEFEIDKQRGIVCARIDGTVRPTDAMDYWQRLWKDPDFSSDLNALVTIDVEGMEPVINPPMLGEWKELVEKYAKMRAGARWALVVHQSLRRRILWEAFSRMNLGTLQVKTFAAEPEAAAWLADGNGKTYAEPI